LEAYAENLIGVNLHDLKDLEAYHPPGSGDLDFKEILSEIPPETLTVLEVRDAPPEQLVEVREEWQLWRKPEEQDGEVERI
jgi:sugar phosphate isomerase/epimerase